MDKKNRILIIDDDKDLILQVKEFLEPEGFEVISAKTGKEGLERVGLDRPDLILLDLMIESHDTGFTVARAIKGSPATRDIPVIMLSSALEQTGIAYDQERDGHWMKTYAFLEKPCDPKTLLPKIRELLEMKNQETD